jgi:2-succinyl-5-enolpyruvyl-6-hydroxy-3-cyclohexene-1-carboxylate synthase
VNPSSALARVLVDEFVRCGVSEAVLAPGSRSAPLAIALQGDDRMRLHVRVDERSAAFLALGLGKISGRPSLLVCTSGSAAANFHPAVVEAHHAHVPLIVLTADRPPELRGTGANQTIDQTRLYGPAVRWFTDVGVPEAVPGMVAYWRSVAGRAFAAAADGPVHINVPLREPLVPDSSGDWPESLDGRADGQPWVRVLRPVQQPPVLDEPPERGAVLVGEGAVDPDAAVALAESVGWPLLSEPTGGARRGPNAVTSYPLLLGDPQFAAGHRPDLVVTVGKPGLSRAVQGWLQSAKRQIVVDPDPDWADPTRTAALVVPAVPAPSPSRSPSPSPYPSPSPGDHAVLRSYPPTAPGDDAVSASAWLLSWRRADEIACTAADAVLDAEAQLSEPRVARDLGAALPTGSLLVAGSSRPIRDLDAYLRQRDDLRVIGNRGASGIDGLVSTAVGAALAHQRDGGGPAYALIGDLAYLHDRNGLVLGPDEPRPDLTLVVIDNDGGGIFSLLPQAGVEGFERVFGTPHGVDLAADAAAVGVPYTRATSADELATALRAGAGLRIVHVRTDRRGTAELHHRLQAAVSTALSPLHHTPPL